MIGNDVNEETRAKSSDSQSTSSKRLSFTRFSFTKSDHTGFSYKRWLLAASFAVPLNQDRNWTLLEFNKIPANAIVFEEKSLKVSVKSSASPLIYKLPQEMRVQGFSWKVQVIGKLAPQNEGFPEDFPMRLGLVAVGENRISRVHRWVAADWVKKLFDLSPPNKGLDKIYFYNLATSPQWLAKSRLHPKSDLMHEHVVASLGENENANPNDKTNKDPNNSQNNSQNDGHNKRPNKSPNENEFLSIFQYKLENPVPVSALWISIDGDDTKSQFTLKILELNLDIEGSL